MSVPADLSLNVVRALLLLRERNKTMAELSDALSITRAATTGLMDRLEECGSGREADGCARSPQMLRRAHGPWHGGDGKHRRDVAENRRTKRNQAQKERDPGNRAWIISIILII